MAETFGDRTAGSAVQPCPENKAATPPASHWLQIELVGEDESPMPWFEYEVTLPDGSKVRGFLDEQGSARIENIQTPGTAQICFVTLDTEAWVPVS